MFQRLKHCIEIMSNVVNFMMYLVQILGRWPIPVLGDQWLVRFWVQVTLNNFAILPAFQTNKPFLSLGHKYVETSMRRKAAISISYEIGRL
jgi:hypothetical protein